MSWMGEIAVIIEQASEYGVVLDLGDFRRLNDRLMIDGMDADDWLSAMTNGYDRLEDGEW
jgi:hypothetical protein